MTRASLEIIGQSGLGYSFDELERLTGGRADGRVVGVDTLVVLVDPLHPAGPGRRPARDHAQVLPAPHADVALQDHAGGDPLVHELEEAAVQVATVIASKGPVATRHAKAALQAARALPLADGLARERASFAALLDTEDWVEGRAALAERRPASFSGR